MKPIMILMLENFVATNIIIGFFFDFLLTNAHMSNVIKGNHEKINEKWVNISLDYIKRNFHRLY